MHFRSQSTRVEAQDRCSPVLSLDAPSSFRKDLKNLVPLRLCLNLIVTTERPHSEPNVAALLP